MLNRSMFTKSALSRTGTTFRLDEEPSHISAMLNRANTESNFATSVHQNLISHYLEATKFESIMTSAIREVFEGDLIPKNPYPKLIRALNTANTQKEVLRNFTEKIKYVTKNITQEEGPFGITSIKGRQVFFGLKHILEWVDVDRLTALRKALLEFLPDYRDEFKDSRIVVSSSVGGGYLLHSKVLPYPESAPAPLEITSEVFVEGNDMQKSMDVFLNFVYDDIQSITNVKSFHIFRYFKVEFYDEQTKKDQVKIWSIQDILSQQHGFLFDVQRATVQKKRILMKIFLKIDRINYEDTADAIRDRKPDTTKNPNYFLDAQFNKNFLFVDTTKYYNFHYIEKSKSQTSYAFHPLRSLLRGVFLDEQVAQKYASFFYKENERYNTSKSFKGFIDNQLAIILPKWKDQNLLYSAWEFFYIALTVENDDQKRKLIDNLIQLLSSEYAYLYSTTRINKVLVFLVIAYRLKTFPFYKFAANEVFKIYYSLIADILAKGGTSEIIVFRDYIQRALGSIMDLETRGLDIHMDTNRVLKSIYRITRAISESNVQIASIYVKNLSEFMYQTFLKAKTLEAKNLDSLTYEASLKEKLPKRVLHISAETKGKTKEAEEQLFMHYINEYELYDYLFLTIQEMFFNPQVPNPIPNISFKMEYQSYKFQLKEVPSERLKSLLNEPAPNQVLVHKTVKYQNIYAYTNEFMESQSLPPIIGLRDIILFTAVNECSSLKTYMDNLHWRKAITKANPNYEVADVFTINPVSLVSHASIVKRRYSEWMVNYDFIIKGPSFEKGTEVFYDIFLRYAQWLESVEDVHVLGFFEGPDAAQPFLDINSLLTNFNTPEPRTLLRNFFANKRRVMLKFISVVEGHFKIIGIYMNMHFLEGAKMKPQSLLTEAVLDNMVKVFFKPEDFILWNKLFPFDREETLNMLDNQIKYMKIVGKLNYAYKLEIIRASLDEDAKLLFKLFRGLFGTAEPFYLAAKEAEALKGAFEILEKVQSGDQVMKKLKLQDTLEFFADFMENLEKRLLVYHNYNIEGIHPKVLNILAKIQALYKPKADLAFDIALERIEKVILYCLSIGDSAYLSFEKNVFERGKLRVV